MAKQPIRLLEAPLLIGSEILRSMKFLDLFVLANTSKLMRSIVRREIKVKNHSLSIFIQPGNFLFEFAKIGTEKVVEFSSISVRRASRINLEEKNFNLRIGRSDVQSFLPQSHEDFSHLATYWNSVFTGIREVYNEINYLFRIAIRKVYIDLNSVGKRCKPVITWINSISSKIPLVQVAGDNCSFELYSWVFDNLRTTREVHFLAKPAEFSNKGAHRITHHDILIKYGQWVKLEHLKLMESSCIHIENSTITDEQINEFLRDLVAGSNPNLRKLVFGMDRDSDVNILLADLDSTQIDEHKWRFDMGNEMDCTVHNVAYEDDEQQGIEIEIGEKRIQKG